MIDSIRIGVVASVDTGQCAVRVKYDDPEMVSGWLPVVQRGAGSFATYDMPNIGDQVLCVHRESGPEEGFCVGTIYSEAQQPTTSGSGIIYTKFPDGSSVKWDGGALSVVALGGVELTADENTINGNVTVNGALNVNGNVIVSGTMNVGGIITAAGFVQG